MTPEEETARRRYMVLNILRLSGLAMVLIGIAIHYGRLDLPEILAWPLALFGLFDFFFAPALLARHWKKTDL